ncbi:T9SS type A sorting domain-containing protein [Fulvivirga sp. M361]|uniref:T9SS type A sorting domain-containing protein n=1 Tax=Fulvivirga sp. M361 TaxID=2594266 RepID=UPI00117A44E9|nr:T9SS type A sorting domain-containing protein [Fulvivirga sp. M361]TRX48074.1 T9SS type A sorting domain-containing protein [Fulvivirga sp. M361]
MKRAVFLLTLGFIALTSNLTAQKIPVLPPTYKVTIDSARFSKQVTIELDVYQGDSMAFEILTLSGARLTELPQRIVYKSERFTMEIPSLSQGLYLTSTTVNSERIAKKLIFDGNGKAVVTLKVNAIDLTKDHLIVYPNPVALSDFTVEILSSSESIQLHVLDLQGRNIYTDKLINPTGRVRKEMNISTLDQGEYILAIESRNGRIHRKFIVTR